MSALAARDAARDLAPCARCRRAQAASGGQPPRHAAVQADQAAAVAARRSGAALAHTADSAAAAPNFNATCPICNPHPQSFHSYLPGLTMPAGHAGAAATELSELTDGEVEQAYVAAEEERLQGHSQVR